MHVPRHTTLVARLDSVWCLARIYLDASLRLYIVLDAGYRPAAPGPQFKRYIRRTWKTIPPGVPGVEERNPPHPDGNAEIACWSWRLNSPSDLARVQLFVRAQWRGLWLEPQSWPIDHFGGDRFFTFATGIVELLVAQDWRRGASGTPHSELDEFITALGQGWSRLAPDDTRAAGAVAFEDCFLTEGPLPEPYASFLASLGGETDDRDASAALS